MHISSGSETAFLNGGGSLGELIAAFDWSRTPLGPIATWDTVLKVSLGLMLRSTVPMIMMWGEDGVMLYNDGYAEIAGARHPGLLGMNVREGWPEVSEFNSNVMRTVLAGGTLAFTDQELTLHRNGVPEQTWFNLDYSPVLDEKGIPVAVLAVVVETTSRVIAETWLSDETRRLHNMFEQAPGFMAMLTGPGHVFEFANAAYRQLIGHRKVIGKTVRDALPEIAEQGFIELLDGVLSSGNAFVGHGLKVWLQRTPGAELEERYVDLVYQPVRNVSGAAVGIFVEGSDVTERVLAEAAVRERDAQFRTFAESMPNHVWTSGPDGQLDWFNSRTYEYTGLTESELVGSGWAQVVHPEDIEAAARRWAESVANGSAYETEFRIRRYDGTYRWHIVRAAIISDETGRYGRWVGSNTDIDDQKQIAQKLAESDARLRLAIEAGQLGIWELDVVNNRVTPSASLNRLYAFPDDAAPTPEEFGTRYAPGEAERFAKLAAEAQARGDKDLEAEVRHIWPDGTEKWLLIRAQSVEEGRRAIGVVIDITERKQVEQKLVESERRFRLSQAAAGIGSLELDIAGGTVIGSDQFWELWGLAPRDRVDIKVLEDLVVPEDSHIRSNPETRQNGSAQPNVEYRIRRADTGELRWLSRHIEFINDEAGRPIKMFGVMQDITERKEAFARQQLLTHELEHRIKNILAMVSAIASQTLRNTDLETASATFNQRLKALANAHDILTSTRWTQASMSEVVKSATSHLPQDRLKIEGPDVALEPKMALSLALAINELCTNALKYGALSNDSGRVDLKWSLVPGPEGVRQFFWRWQERDGPPVTAPERRGFGRFLIERVLAADFHGEVSLDYRPEGLECLLRAPLPGSGTVQPSQGVA